MAEHVCPWWLGYVLANPLRKLLQNPESILSPYIKEGMTVLDIGSAMGFFSIPMARLVGATGKVICVDLQEKMIAGLQKRINKAGFSERTETRVCPKISLGITDLSETVDFALAFALVHEVPDQAGLLQQVHQALKPGGKLMISEPSGHVSSEKFEKTIQLAMENGFAAGDSPVIKRSFTRILIKNP